MVLSTLRIFRTQREQSSLAQKGRIPIFAPKRPKCLFVCKKVLLLRDNPHYVMRLRILLITSILIIALCVMASARIPTDFTIDNKRIDINLRSNMNFRLIHNPSYCMAQESMFKSNVNELLGFMHSAAGLSQKGFACADCEFLEDVSFEINKLKKKTTSIKNCHLEEMACEEVHFLSKETGKQELMMLSLFLGNYPADWYLIQQFLSTDPLHLVGNMIDAYVKSANKAFGC